MDDQRGDNPSSLTEWKALYEQAVKFKEIAPWDWMEDSDLFGVKNPADGEIGYCDNEHCKIPTSGHQKCSLLGVTQEERRRWKKI